MKIKNYSKITRNAPKFKVKGKVKIKSFGGFGAGVGFGAVTDAAFLGPSLQQRLFGWAAASTLVTVNLEDSSFRGRIVTIDGNAFEMTVTDPLTSIFPVGSIVLVSLKQVNAIAATGI
jgi:hypothetical protein